ncbi:MULTISPECIES: signal peptidase II [Nocardioides]|uniref:Lipoprotein signal peptidase n=1 Tax=Nocardioides vastitatis TaxID=2568655 RepID=A0ABW0ZBU4_9ACTN|nr:signal peptidase II [Nocardioides sp.]
MPVRRTWSLFLAVAAVLYAADQVTKHLAVTHLADRPDVRVIGEVLQLHLTYNPGAAFSLGTEFTVGLTVLATVATGVVLWISRRVGDRIWAVALGLLLAGIDGNLTDRLVRDPAPLRGHVVDFLMLPNWPVFNVADICINIAVGLILLQVFRGIAVDGTRVDRPTADDSSDTDGPGEGATDPAPEGDEE